MMRFIKGFARFWYDFIVGDDWKIAAAVVAVMLVGLAATASDAVPTDVIAPGVGILLLAGFTIAVLLDVRERGGSR
jgi:hypothetical protein